MPPFGHLRDGNARQRRNVRGNAPKGKVESLAPMHWKWRPEKSVNPLGIFNVRAAEVLLLQQAFVAHRISPEKPRLPNAVRTADAEHL